MRLQPLSGGPLRWYPRGALGLDLAAIVSSLAYGFLALESWEKTHVGLSVFLTTQGVAWGAMLAVYFRARRSAGEFSRQRLLVWAILFRLIGLAGNPVLEDDYYRYLWDGRAFAIQGTPYGDRPLDHFADEALPPRFQDILDNINNPDVPTIYGPVYQYAFLLSYWIAPGQLPALKLLLLLADMAALALLLRMVRSPQLLLYAWCPLLIKEVAFTAHPESLGIALLLAALDSRQRGKPAQTAILAALASGARVFALLLVPFLLARGGKRSWGLFALTLLAVYLPFLLQGSWGESAGLTAFVRDWEFNSFVFGLLAAGLGAPAAKLLSAGAFGLLYLCHYLGWRKRGSLDIPRGDWILGALFLFSPVVNPWYVLWMLPFVVLHPSSWGIAALLSVNLSYFHGGFLARPDLPQYHHPPWVRPLELALVLMAGVKDLWRGKRSAAEGDVAR